MASLAVVQSRLRAQLSCAAERNGAPCRAAGPCTTPRIPKAMPLTTFGGAVRGRTLVAHPTARRTRALSRRGLTVRQALTTELSTRIPVTTVEAGEELAGGHVHVVRFERQGRAGVDLVARIWTPPGHAELVDGESVGLILLNNGEDLAQLVPVVAGLMQGGLARSAVIAAIDPVEPDFYCPYLPAETKEDLTAAPRWDETEGGVKAYLGMIVEQVVPQLQSEFKVSMESDDLIYGGSGLGGVNALCMAMAYPEAFASILIDSPAFWLAERRFLQEVCDAELTSAPIIHVSMGQSDSAKTTEENAEIDKLLVENVSMFADVLSKKFGDERVRYLLDELAEKSTPDRLVEAAMCMLPHTLAAEGGTMLHTFPKKPVSGRSVYIVFSANHCESMMGASTVTVHYGFNGWQDASTVQMHECLGSPGVFVAAISVPSDALEVNYALTDGSHWENNDGCNYRIRLREGKASLASELEKEKRMIEDANRTAYDDQYARAMARKNPGALFFTAPEKLVPGATARVYMDKMRSLAGLASSSRVNFVCGFNDWAVGNQTIDLKPDFNLDGIDWWVGEFEVPETAVDINFSFTNGVEGDGAIWDNNDDNDFSVPIKKMAKNRRVPREIEEMSSAPHGAGTLHICKLKRKEGISRRLRWKIERIVRVWTPPGYDMEAAKSSADGIPVLYLNDGKNLFEDWLAHEGVSWNAGYTASALVEEGKVPPFILVGIDSPGPFRSLSYLPFPPGCGVGGFRPDAERWPGGGVAAYMERLTEEIVPMITSEFGGASDPSRLAFGGASFGGVCAIYAGMHYSHVFGAILAESPSLWSGNARFLEDMRRHEGMLPDRMFMGVGTREYSATRPEESGELDHLLLQYAIEAKDILESKGMQYPRLAFQIEEGGGHHEGAWSWRLKGALEYLLNPWFEDSDGGLPSSTNRQLEH